MGKIVPVISILGKVMYAPELRYTVNGIARCNFKLKQDDGTMVNITAWRELGEQCNEVLSLSDEVSVTGKPYTRAYQDPEGIERTFSSINAIKVYLIDKKVVQGRTAQMIDIMTVSMVSDTSPEDVRIDSSAWMT